MHQKRGTKIAFKGNFITLNKFVRKIEWKNECANYEHRNYYGTETK